MGFTNAKKDAFVCIIVFIAVFAATFFLGLAQIGDYSTAAVTNRFFTAITQTTGIAVIVLAVRLIIRDIKTNGF